MLRQASVLIVRTWMPWASTAGNPVTFCSRLTTPQPPRLLDTRPEWT
jgi:hypothetical protein